MSAVKNAQLGMSAGKARNILVNDILWSLICETDKNKCFHCNEPMTRLNFSIEHKDPWMYSENPAEKFFDLDNISFSHLACNVGAARRDMSVPNRKPREVKHGTINEYRYGGCRCDLCQDAQKKEAQERKKKYDPEKRRQKYLEKGN